MSLFSDYTDNQLLGLIAGQNEQALEALYHRYYVSLCAFAIKRIPDESVVEELVQDVFVNLWLKAFQLNKEGEVRAYLYATLRNKTLNEQRSRLLAASRAAELHQAEPQGLDNEIENNLNGKDLEDRLHHIIQELSPQCREAFTLSRYEQLPYKLIADRMDISVNTVEKHIGKALKILRKELSEFDFTT